MPEGEIGHPLQSLPEIQPENQIVSLGEHWREALPIMRTLLERARNWREQLPPEFRRAFSAGRILFQVVGIAGYAGYFSSMHTLMRVVSIALVSGSWYVIYWLKKEFSPSQP